MVEDPAGSDLASARRRNDELHQVWDEDQIHRIDHFSGRPPVLGIAFLRFANAPPGPVRSRDHVAAVRITMAAVFGVEDRDAL